MYNILLKHPAHMPLAWPCCPCLTHLQFFTNTLWSKTCTSAL